MKKFMFIFFVFSFIFTQTLNADEIIIINEENYNQIGNDQVISNVTYKIENVPANFKGVYSTCEDMTFENVTIEANDVIKSNTSSVGSLCGSSYRSTFKDVTNNISLSSTSNSKGYYGGIAGYGQTNTFINVVNNGNISAYNRVGGLIGSLSNSYGENIFENVVNNGNIAGRQYKFYSHAGGIVGYLNDGTLNNVQNNGDVSGSYRNIGGIVGKGEKVIIEEATNTGNIKGHQSFATEVGGIGGNLINSHLNMVENQGDIQGRINVGGVVGAFSWTSAIDCKSLLELSTIETEQGCGIINSLNTGDISGNSYNIGGVVGTAVNTQTFEYLDKPLGTSSSYTMYIFDAQSLDFNISIAGNNRTGDSVGGIGGHVKSVVTGQYTPLIENVNSINVNNVVVDKVNEGNNIKGRDNVAGTVGLLTNVAVTNAGTNINTINISNVFVNETTITGRSNVGGISGKSNAFLDEVSVGAYTTIKGTSQDIGGIVGLNFDKVANSRMSGVVQGEKNTGGLIGHNEGVLESSVSTALILPNSGEELDYSESASFVGGLVGKQENIGRTINCVYSQSMSNIKNETINFIPSFHGYLGQSSDATQLTLNKYKYLLKYIDENEIEINSKEKLEMMDSNYVDYLIGYDNVTLTIEGEEFDLDTLPLLREEKITEISQIARDELYVMDSTDSGNVVYLNFGEKYRTKGLVSILFYILEGIGIASTGEYIWSKVTDINEYWKASTASYTIADGNKLTFFNAKLPELATNFDSDKWLSGGSEVNFPGSKNIENNIFISTKWDYEYYANDLKDCLNTCNLATV